MEGGSSSFEKGEKGEKGEGRNQRAKSPSHGMTRITRDDQVSPGKHRTKNPSSTTSSSSSPSHSTSSCSSSGDISPQPGKKSENRVRKRESLGKEEGNINKEETVKEEAKETKETKEAREAKEKEEGSGKRILRTISGQQPEKGKQRLPGSSIERSPTLELQDEKKKKKPGYAFFEKRLVSVATKHVDVEISGPTDFRQNVEARRIVEEKIKDGLPAQSSDLEPASPIQEEPKSFETTKEKDGKRGIVWEDKEDIVFMPEDLENSKLFPRIRLASEDKLIQFLSHPDYAERSIRTTFLITYRSFTTPQTFLLGLIKHFQVDVRPVLTAAFPSPEQSDVLASYLELLKQVKEEKEVEVEEEKEKEEKEEEEEKSEEGGREEKKEEESVKEEEKGVELENQEEKETKEDEKEKTELSAEEEKERQREARRKEREKIRQQLADESSSTKNGGSRVGESAEERRAARAERRKQLGLD